MLETQKSEILWLFASLLRIPPGKSTKLDTAGLIFRQFEPKLLQSVFQASVKSLRLVLVLKAGQKIVGEAEMLAVKITDGN